MIEINNLQVSRGGREVLKGVTFEVRLNQIVGIKGTTSSGKSSIPEAILHFVEFSNGTVIYENKKVAYNQPKQIENLRKRVGYIPQKDYFLQNGRLIDNLQWIGRASKERVIELATTLEIADSIYKSADEVSGVEKLRFKLALALINSPEILFIDEPLSDISPEEISEFLELISRVSRVEKIGVLILSQYEPLFENSEFSKVYRLENGVLHEF
jgi:phosphonate transport system ATP-binding protein